MPHRDREQRLAYHRRYFQEHREEAVEYARRNRERVNARRRERHREKRAGIQSRRITHGKTHTPEYRMLLGAKKRASAAGLPFALTVHEIPSIPARCPVLGVAIAIGGERGNSPSLDRVDPARGYVAGNVRVVSWRANRLRSDATAAELFMVADYAARLEAGLA